MGPHFAYSSLGIKGFWISGPIVREHQGLESEGLHYVMHSTTQDLQESQLQKMIHTAILFRVSSTLWILPGVSGRP